MFRVTVKTTQLWDRAGKLRTIRTPGNRRLFFADQVDALLADSTAGRRAS
jgi:DNA-binding transcriptional MerR regulator